MLSFLSGADVVSAGVVGAMLGGSLSDRFGRRMVLITSMSTASVFIFVFLFVFLFVLIFMFFDNF